MGKLHEYLAVEGDLAGAANKIVEETTGVFGGKAEHFTGAVQTTTYFDDASTHLNTVDSRAMVTTVGQKLDHTLPFVERYWNAFLVKEQANQLAKADIVVDGKTLWAAVPATALLGLETKLKALRPMYEAAPTLQPGVTWDADPTAGAGIYVSREPETRFVTNNTVIPIELSPATKEHKAQVAQVNKDVPVAKRVITHQSGMLSPADKSDLLARLDKLIRAVKTARQQANSVEAPKVEGFGEALLGYVHQS